MPSELTIGVIGLDTSHAVAFTQLLNDRANEHHVFGGRVTAAFPGGSADFEPSRSRVDAFTGEVRDRFGVTMLDSAALVAERCDAILLESVDGRVHVEQFREIARFGRPTFIDKPLAVSVAEAAEIFALARRAGTPIMSTSALRYADWVTALVGPDPENITGIDCYAPMHLQPTQPGLFWYGIHGVEILYTALGTGCRTVSATRTDDHEVIAGTWSDGRIGVLRGSRGGQARYGCVVHRVNTSGFAEPGSAGSRPMYASLLNKIMHMFHTGEHDVAPAETLEIMAFIEAANRSRETGQSAAVAEVRVPN